MTWFFANTLHCEISIDLFDCPIDQYRSIQNFQGNEVVDFWRKSDYRSLLWSTEFLSSLQLGRSNEQLSFHRLMIWGYLSAWRQHLYLYWRLHEARSTSGASTHCNKSLLEIILKLNEWARFMDNRQNCQKPEKYTRNLGLQNWQLIFFLICFMWIALWRNGTSDTSD